MCAFLKSTSVQYCSVVFRCYFVNISEYIDVNNYIKSLITQSSMQGHVVQKGYLKKITKNYVISTVSL